MLRWTCLGYEFFVYIDLSDEHAITFIFFFFYIKIII